MTNRLPAPPNTTSRELRLWLQRLREKVETFDVVNPAADAPDTGGLGQLLTYNALRNRTVVAAGATGTVLGGTTGAVPSFQTLGAALDKALGESLAAMTDVAPADLIPVYDADGAVTKSATVAELLNAVNGLTDIAAGTDPAADFLLLFDADAASVKKVTPDGLGVGGAWDLVIRHDTLNGTSAVEFTTLSTEYDYFVFVFMGVDLSNGTADIRLRCSTTGGAPYDSSNGDYVLNANASANSFLVNYTGTTAFDNFSGEVHMYGAHETNMRTGFLSRVLNVTGGASTAASIYTNGGVYDFNTAVTAVQLSLSAGEFTSGVISLYGVKNA